MNCNKENENPFLVEREMYPSNLWKFGQHDDEDEDMDIDFFDEPQTKSQSLVNSDRQVLSVSNKSSSTSSSIFSQKDESSDFPRFNFQKEISMSSDDVEFDDWDPPARKRWNKKRSRIDEDSCGQPLNLSKRLSSDDDMYDLGEPQLVRGFSLKMRPEDEELQARFEKSEIEISSDKRFGFLEESKTSVPEFMCHLKSKSNFDTVSPFRYMGKQDSSPTPAAEKPTLVNKDDIPLEEYVPQSFEMEYTPSL